ncbi:MAG: tRNA pseudouridine(55) synthase TruB [Opitutales bacterium]|nr:tRNA pseudouridine(55) synthase TruB [Opitutales bacterium]
METKLADYEGILLIDKAPGCTSHDVVNGVRHALKMRSVGHAGTLDPLATGLLIILVGKATKASQYLMSVDKIYEGSFKLGEETNTQDCEGEVVKTSPVPGLSAQDLEKYMASFLGDQYQTPPMFSAKKIGGVPLYKLARKGKEVEREPRFIRISKFELLEWNPETKEAKFRIACSKGTYVRTVCHDLGAKIGCGAHMSALRRIKSGSLDISSAVTLEELKEMPPSAIRKILIPVSAAVPSIVF